MTSKEALKCLEGIEYVADVLKVNHKIGSRDIANQEIKEMVDRLNYRIPIIKQALLKSQEQEKDLEVLEQYKDIEEKLEIDVPTYFKYVGSEKAFVKDDNGYIEECYVMGGTLDSIILMQVAFPYGECELTRKFKYYGEQWALTIEELENEHNGRKNL